MVLGVVPAALSFVEGQDDAPALVVRNDAGAPDRLKDGSDRFTQFVPPYFSSSGNVAYAWGFAIL